MTDYSDARPLKKNFSWIKQNLNPAKGYIVFENDLKNTNTSILNSPLITCACPEKEYNWYQVIDKNLLREYLVICVEPGEEERILGRIMGSGFPENVVYYLFKADKRLK